MANSTTRHRNADVAVVRKVPLPVTEGFSASSIFAFSMRFLRERDLNLTGTYAPGILGSRNVYMSILTSDSKATVEIRGYRMLRIAPELGERLESGINGLAEQLERMSAATSARRG